MTKPDKYKLFKGRRHMKPLSLLECRAKVKENEIIVPSDMKLWKKVKEKTDTKSKALLVKIYESMGGRWKVMRSSIPGIQTRIVDEDAGPLTGTKYEGAGKDWAHRLKMYDPIAYQKFINWD